jgi:hypothetical protein
MQHASMLKVSAANTEAAQSAAGWAASAGSRAVPAPEANQRAEAAQEATQRPSRCAWLRR